MTGRTAGPLAAWWRICRACGATFPLFASGRSFSSWDLLHRPIHQKFVAVEGIDKIGDHSAYRVVGERKDGVDRLYFDTDSGLLLRAWTTFDTAIGETPQQTDYEDYQRRKRREDPLLGSRCKRPRVALEPTNGINPGERYCGRIKASNRSAA